MVLENMDIPRYMSHHYYMGFNQEFTRRITLLNY